MGSHRRSSKRRKRDHDWPDLEDLFDLDDLLSLGKRLDLGDLFDSRKWRGLKKRAVVDAWSKFDSWLPIGLGIAALVAAIVFAGGPIMILLAVIALTFGISRFVWRAWVGFRQVTRGFQKMFLSKQEQQQHRLIELENKLRADQDPRTHTLLNSLTQLRQSLEQDIPQANFSVLKGDVLQRVDQMFMVCLQHLEETHQLWQSAQGDKFAGPQKLAQRELLIEEVQACVQQLEAIATHLRQRQVHRTTSELQRLRDELDETMRVAKRVEQRTDELLNPQPMSANFPETEKVTGG